MSAVYFRQMNWEIFSLKIGENLFFGIRIGTIYRYQLNKGGGGCQLTHKSCRVVLSSSHLAINFDQSLHCDLFDLIICQSILKTVPQEHNEGERLTELVGSSAGSWSLRGTNIYTQDYLIVLSSTMS